MKGKDIIFEYTDKNGKEVLLSQNGRTGGIMVSSRAEKDMTMPSGKITHKGEWSMEFHAAGGKGAKHYDRQGLINWYENDYKKLQKMFDEIDWDSIDDEKDSSSRSSNGYER